MKTLQSVSQKTIIRNSDGEVFSVGDKIDYKDISLKFGYTIQFFEHGEHGVTINRHYRTHDPQPITIENWVKVKGTA